MDRGSGVFIKYGVAARGFYIFFNFVNVLLVVKYDGGVAFVSRKESKLGSLFHQGLQSSTLFTFTFDTFDEFVDPPLGHLLRPPLQSCDCFIYTPIQQ